MSIEYGEDIKVPAVLYKYRDWDNVLHRDILIKQELYFAKPSTFGDIEYTRECNLPTDYSNVDEERLYRYFYNIAERECSNWSMDKINEFAEHWAKNTPLHDSKLRLQNEKEFIDDLDKVLGVLSLSPLWNNTNLWTFFANNGEGICVGFDGEKLFDDETHFGTGGKVQYYEPGNIPKLTPFLLTSDDRIRQMLKVIFSLPIKFYDEQEYRISKINIKNRNVKIPSDVIKEVVLGFNIPENYKNDIVNIVKKNIPNVNIYNATIDSEGNINREILE